MINTINFLPFGKLILFSLLFYFSSAINVVAGMAEEKSYTDRKSLIKHQLDVDTEYIFFKNESRIRLNGLIIVCYENNVNMEYYAFHEGFVYNISLDGTRGSLRSYDNVKFLDNNTVGKYAVAGKIIKIVYSNGVIGEFNLTDENLYAKNSNGSVYSRKCNFVNRPQSF
jgi:hypothetical protein